ncbi:MAG TPA: hypothetical protein VKU41_31220 [Polyangiaceae bacterium]|nr:hypothetical protein [Polyangiaceae bacterium]
MPPRRPRTFAFGVRLAQSGGLVGLGLGVAGILAVASIAAALALRGDPLVNQVPSLACQALAWGAGITVAFGAARRAASRDRDEGFFALARCRGVTPYAYVEARVVGLAALVAVAVGGGTALAGAAAALSSPSAGVFRATGGALAYALVFSATISPVAFASLAAGSTVTGYLALASLLVLPELASPWTSALLPAGWHELTSVPAALDAIRTGAGWHAARALAGLTALAAASLAILMGRTSSEPDP